MSAHIGDDAEMYAVGLLAPLDAKRVEAHAGQCALCAAALDRAVATVAAMESADTRTFAAPASLARRFTTRRGGAGSWTTRWGALAAVAVLAVGLGGGLARSEFALHALETSDNIALTTIANAHFNHVSFTPSTPSAPVVKALYARTGDWIYVIVDRADCDCRITATTSAGSVDLGSPQPHGATSTLFVPRADTPTSLALVERNGGRQIASAKLVYPH